MNMSRSEHVSVMAARKSFALLVLLALTILPTGLAHAVTLDCVLTTAIGIDPDGKMTTSATNFPVRIDTSDNNKGPWSTSDSRYHQHYTDHVSDKAVEWDITIDRLDGTLDRVQVWHLNNGTPFSLEHKGSCHVVAVRPAF